MSMRRGAVLLALALAACDKTADPAAAPGIDASAAAVRKAVRDTDAATQEAIAGAARPVLPAAPAVEQEAASKGSAP